MSSDLEKLVKNARPRFEPGAHYSPEAESLHIFISGEDSVGHVVDEHLTIYERRGEPAVTGIFLEAVLRLIFDADTVGGMFLDHEGRLTAATALHAYLDLRPERWPASAPAAELIEIGLRHVLEVGG